MLYSDQAAVGSLSVESLFLTVALTCATVATGSRMGLIPFEGSQLHHIKHRALTQAIVL